MKKTVINELLDYIQPSKFIVDSEEYSDDYDIPVLTAGDSFILGYTNENKGVYEASKEKPIILFDDFTTSIQLVDFPFKVKSSACKIIIPKNNVDIKYCYYALKSLDFDHSQHKRYWISEFSKKTINDYGADNYRIVKELDKICCLINSKKSEILSLDELIKSRFIEMFGNLENNSNNYPIKYLNEIAEYWNGLTYKPIDVTENNEGVLVLRSSNIQNGELSFEDNVYVSCNIKEKQYVKENDILMCSRNGSARLVGKVAIIKGISKPTSFGAFMMIIRSAYYPYLKAYFETSSFRAQLATGTSTINQITGGMLNSIKLPIPDMDTVIKFKDYCELIDKSKFIVQQQIKDLQELLDKKMDEYFGE